MNQPLKVGIFLAIDTQEDFNELARLTKAFVEDSLTIDDEYVAYLDFEGAIEGAIYVRKVVDFHEEYPQYKDTKLKVFKRWKRKFV